MMKKSADDQNKCLKLTDKKILTILQNFTLVKSA